MQAWLDRLASSPVLLREMDIRADRYDGYRLFNYNGPGRYLLLILSPLIFNLAWLALCNLVAIVAEGPSSGPFLWTPSLFLVTAWLQVLYFAHSAARFCAGSVVVERERGTLAALMLLPRPSSDLFTGKFLAAVAPLVVEALLSAPLLGLYAFFGAVTVSSVVGITVLNLAVIVFFGLWGMYWSVSCRDVVSAISRAFCTVFFVNCLPLMCALMVGVMSLCGDGAGDVENSLLVISPLYLVGGLLVPWRAQAALWPVEPWLLLAVATLALGISTVLLRVTLRRLSGR